VKKCLLILLVNSAVIWPLIRLLTFICIVLLIVKIDFYL